MHKDIPFTFEKNACRQVSVPSSSLFTVVTVRCGHCGNLLSVNMGGSLQTAPLQDPQVYFSCSFGPHLGTFSCLTYIISCARI